jgi:hypothetical protein
MIMEALEINAKTDDNGVLHINLPLSKKNSNVRIIILLEEELSAIRERYAQSDSFDFWSTAEEDLYQDLVPAIK